MQNGRGHSRNRRDQRPQQPRYDDNNYPGGPKPQRATMPPPMDENVDLEGTLAHPNDPFWMRRRYTRNDSFPELRELDQQQFYQNQPQPQYRQQQQPVQNKEHSRSRRKRHQNNNPPRQSNKQGNRQPPRSYQKPQPPVPVFGQAQPVTQMQPQFQKQSRNPQQPFSPQPATQRQPQYHQQSRKPQPPVPQFGQSPFGQQPPRMQPQFTPQPTKQRQPQVSQFNPQPGTQRQPQFNPVPQFGQPATQRKPQRTDATQPRQTPQFVPPNDGKGFRLPPFNPNFKGQQRPASQFAPPSSSQPVHLPRSSAKTNSRPVPPSSKPPPKGFMSQSTFSPPSPKPTGQGFRPQFNAMQSGSSFAPVQVNQNHGQPRQRTQDQQSRTHRSKVKRGRKVPEDVGLDVLMSKTFASKKSHPQTYGGSYNL